MSPQSEAHSETPYTIAEYSQHERLLLLRLAHRSIESVFGGERLDLTPPTGHLAEARGAFTTLHLHGKLRGCIGYIMAKHSLYRTVADTAQAAAFEDPRFTPVTAEEAPQVMVEISVLSALQPIQPQNVIVGRHGLMISKSGQRGLLLPQVPVEWQWDRLTYLDQICLKAGLPSDAWRQGADLQAFTAEVFGEYAPRAQTA
jgi:AmmeMemoRadiSam system protein A